MTAPNQISQCPHHIEWFHCNIYHRCSKHSQVTTKSRTRAKSNGQTTLVELTLHYHCSCLAICSWSIDLLVNLHTQKARKSVKNSLTEIKKFQKHNTWQKHIHRWLKNHRVKCITLGVCDDNRTLTTHTHKSTPKRGQPQDCFQITSTTNDWNFKIKIQLTRGLWRNSTIWLVQRGH